MIARRLLPALIFVILILSLGACGPFGDDDDDSGDNPNPAQPTATRAVVISTFTPTAVVAPADQMAPVMGYR